MIAECSLSSFFLLSLALSPSSLAQREGLCPVMPYLVIIAKSSGLGPEIAT